MGSHPRCHLQLRFGHLWSKREKKPDWFQAGIAVLEPAALAAKRSALLNYKRDPSEKTLAALRAARNDAQRTAASCGACVPRGTVWFSERKIYTIDMIFSLRQLQEKCKEQRQPLFLAFIDLTKAFDLVSRKGLFTLLQRIGCSPKLLRMIISFHKDMQGTSCLLWRFNIRSFSYQKRCETGMCPRTNTFWHLFLPAFGTCF